MAHVFYDDYIDWEKLMQSLNALGIEGDERLELVELAEETVHTEVLTVIMSYLPESRHEEFIASFHEAPHDEVHLTYLRVHADPQIHLHIQKRSGEVIEELLLDLITKE